MSKPEDAILEPIHETVNKKQLDTIYQNTSYNGCTFYLGATQQIFLNENYFSNCSFRTKTNLIAAGPVTFTNCGFSSEMPLRLDSLNGINLLSEGKIQPEMISQISLMYGGLSYCPEQLNNLISSFKDLVSLKSLNLSNHGLTELPTEIGHLKALKTLNLRGNNISSLPAEIGSLSSLTDLRMTDNSLEELPIEIGKISSLKGLYLGENSLRTLPPEIGQLRGLMSLDISHNQLNNLPTEITHLTKLMSVKVSGNSFSEIHQPIANFLAMPASERLFSTPIPSNIIENAAQTEIEVDTSVEHDLTSELPFEDDTPGF